MATKASNIAQGARSVDASGNIEADTLDTIDSSQFLRADQAAEITGTITADTIVVDQIDPAGNITPSTDNAHLSGYGIIGNRGTFYVTNPGTVQIGVGSTHDSDSAMTFTTTQNTSLKTLYENSNRVFTDGYHPNADAWTTGRQITLAGDLSGNVTIDGSSNVTLTATVANDSHTHDGRYYTEAESDARFLGISATATDSDRLDGRQGSDYTLDAIAFAIALG